MEHFKSVFNTDITLIPNTNNSFLQFYSSVRNVAENSDENENKGINYQNIKYNKILQHILIRSNSDKIM